MINRVTIRRFKRFREVTFELPGHIVLAGPNNTGKTTVLQAIAAWGLAIDYWKRRNDYQRPRGVYTKQPIARQAFSAVPVRSFDLLWRRRRYKLPIEIEIRGMEGANDWTVTMEFIPDSTEQIYVRPKADVPAAVLRGFKLPTVFIPPMTGLGVNEPVYQRPKVDQLLGLGKPGDVIRNLLDEAHNDQDAWNALTDCIHRLFGYEMLPPNPDGPDIIAEYKSGGDGPRLDIASAGSGFQQVLMLLAFLHARPASVLLLDEPDAHLHVILQDVIYSELHSVAMKQHSQLIIATHSEVIINSVDPRQLCMLLSDEPKSLEGVAERTRLIAALKILPQTDIMQALETPGVLYLEDYTDLNILREWARVLNHPAYETLTTKLFWKKTVWETREGSPGIKARDHYAALTLVKDLPGLELIDGDAHPDITDTEISGKGLQRMRWKRYEVESYLLHPAALARYVEKMIAPEPELKAGAAPYVQALRQYFDDNLPPAVVRDPLGDHAFLNNTKARTEILPPMLAAAGLPGIPYTEFHEIAAVMLPEEIHPEVKEKLDGIQKAFSL
jgi:AAA domain, putative AbiEii toxin, Type IV TA system